MSRVGVDFNVTFLKIVDPRGTFFHRVDMRFALLILGLAACTGHGESPTTCDVDLEITGSPGTFSSQVISTSESAHETRCLLLDTIGARRRVALQIADGFELLHYELVSPAGEPLGSGDGQVVLELPPDLLVHLIVELAPISPAISSSATVSFAFAERQ